MVQSMCSIGVLQHAFQQLKKVVSAKQCANTKFTKQVCLQSSNLSIHSSTWWCSTTHCCRLPIHHQSPHPSKAHSFCNGKPWAWYEGKSWEPKSQLWAHSLWTAASPHSQCSYFLLNARLSAKLVWALATKPKFQRQMNAIQIPLHPAMCGKKKSIAAMFALAHHRANPLANHLAKGPAMHLAKGLARGLSNQLSI